MAEVIYDHINSLLKNAEEKETNQNWKEAFDAYMNSAQLLIMIVGKETDEEKKRKLGILASSAMDKAEAIKATYLSESLTQSQKGLIMTQNESYTVHFRIEKVKCVSIISTHSQPQLLVEDTLQLLLIEEQYYINIGNKFAYGLNQNIPCLAMSSGYYILPGNENTFFGIIFPEGIPYIYCQRFEQKLTEICTFKSSVTQPSKIEEPDDIPQNQIVIHQEVEAAPLPLAIINQENINSITEKVEIGGQWVSHGILVGAEFISKKIESSVEKLKEVIVPVENPPEVPETIKNTISLAKQVTPHLAEFSGLLVSSVHSVVKGVGHLAAEQIKSRLSNSNGDNKEEDPRLTAAKNLGKTSAVALVSIWHSLDEAGMNIMNSTGKAVVNIVHHKYGEEIGKVTKDGISVAQDVVLTTNTLKSMGVKSLAKKAVKQSTKTFVGIGKSNKSSTLQITEELTEDDFSDLTLPASTEQMYVYDIDSDDEEEEEKSNEPNEH